MSLLQISEELAQTIQQAAHERKMSVEDYLIHVVRRERTLAQQQKIEQEQAWWLSQPLSERAKYEGQYIAVHEQRLVDYDQDKTALYRRIRDRYGKRAVLLMPAEGPKELHIYSPRLDRG
jgi:hypothetical protein